MENIIDRHRVAVVYHYWAQYREPIVRLLCQQATPDPEYTLISGVKVETEDQSRIVTIDPNKSTIPVNDGGLRWNFVRNIWVGKIFLWQTGLLRLAISKKYDVIIYLGSMYFISTWLSAVMAKLYGKKVLMWSHGYLSEEKSIKGYIRKLFYNIADGMLLYGNRARQIMINKGFKEDRLYVIYNSLDYEKQSIVRNSMKRDSVDSCKISMFKNYEYPTLFFIGRLVPNKKLDMIIYAAKQLHMDNMPVNILFIGSGPEEAHLKSIVSQNNLDDYVCFYGPCYAENELGLLIMSSDICVSPGNVGLTAMHAMAYGKPVITHDDFSRQNPEYESIIPGKTGSFFKYGDLDSLTCTISGWVKGKNYSTAYLDCLLIIEKIYNPQIQANNINFAIKDVFEKKHNQIFN